MSTPLTPCLTTVLRFWYVEHSDLRPRTDETTTLGPKPALRNPAHDHWDPDRESAGPGEVWSGAPRRLHAPLSQLVLHLNLDSDRDGEGWGSRTDLAPSFPSEVRPDSGPTRRTGFVFLTLDRDTRVGQ